MKLYVTDTEVLCRSPFRSEGFLVQLLENSLHLSGLFQEVPQLKTAACLSSLHGVADQNRV